MEQLEIPHYLRVSVAGVRGTARRRKLHGATGAIYRPPFAAAWA